MSLLDTARKSWPAYELAMFNELGATATLFMPGAPRRAGAALTSTTFTTRRQSASGVEATVTSRQTASAIAPYSWATPFDLTKASNWKGSSPALTFNGTTENMDTPDAAYWSRPGNTAFSVGAWINTASLAASQLIIGRWDETTGAEAREFRFQVTVTTGTLNCVLYDETANIQVARPSSTGLSVNQWTHVVMTYAGTTGATAADDIHAYINGALNDGAAGNNGSFVSMQDTAELTRVGAYISTAGARSTFFNGKMAMGPGACPFFTQVALTAAQIKNLYYLGADVLGL